MSISAPPAPPASRQAVKPTALEALREQALIEEARRRARRRRQRNAATAVLAAGLALAGLLAMHFGHGGLRPEPPAGPERPSASPTPQRPVLPTDAALTILQSPETPVGQKAEAVDSISAIGLDGRPARVWRCPRNRSCGHLISAAWAPDGKRLAISLTGNPSGVGGNGYPGLHIIDVTTGQDQLVLGDVPNAQSILFGCVEPDELAWSPDGSKLAYTCEVATPTFASSQIHIMSIGQAHAQLLATGTASAAWPTWSPDGSRIAFSTWRSATEHRGKSTRPEATRARSLIYSLALDGSNRRLLVADAAAPAWSPDGLKIAYQSGCGRVRMVTSDGRDATPRTTSSDCAGLGPPGWPSWAPDGSRLAIATTHGIYLMKPDGSGLTHIKRFFADEPWSVGFYRPGVARLAWRPLREPRAQ